MRPIVTDRVAWFTGGLLVCHFSEPRKNSWTDRDAVWVIRTRVGPANHVLDAVQILGGNFDRERGVRL